MRPLFIALLITTVVILAWGFEVNTVVDDAYITFQYSKQVANGAGIVYFPGDLPSQGSTSMFFMLLVSAGLRVGIAAEISAFLLNSAGILMMVSAIYLFSRYITIEPVWRIILAILPTLHLLVYFNQSTGMETNFWAGLVLLTAALLTLPRTQRLVTLYTILSFLICLTRPDSVLFVGMWWLLLLVENRQQNLPLLAGFVVVGLAYLAFLTAYFGTVFPTSFYVKVGGDGAYEVIHFLTQVIVSPVVILGIWLLRRSPILKWTAPMFLLLLLFVFTEPVNPIWFRFFHPITVISAAYATFGTFIIAKRIFPRMREAYRPYVKLMAMLILFVVIAYPLAAQFSIRVSRPPHPLRLWSHALAEITTPLTIAYADAGMLPYFSGHRLIDFVGLAEPVIAHEAKDRGTVWIIDYVLDQHPDLIGFYVDVDGRVSNESHGVIGTAYSDLYQTPDFESNYSFVGAIDYTGIYCAWFVRMDSPALAAIQAVISPLSVVSMPPITP